MIDIGFTFLRRYLPLKPANTGKPLKDSGKFNIVLRIMKFCMEVYFLTINKKVKVATGVISRRWR